jgi:hypothetical protein
MTMRRLTVGVVTGVMGVGAIAPVAADASSVSVRDAIATAEHSFKSSPAFAYMEKHASKLTTKAELKAALPKLKQVSALYSKVAKYVASSQATTSTDKTARTAWVHGAQLGSQEYAALIREFNDVLAGNQSGAKAAEKQALSLAKQGTAELDKADKLLGLPKGA